MQQKERYMCLCYLKQWLKENQPTKKEESTFRKVNYIFKILLEIKNWKWLIYLPLMLLSIAPFVYENLQLYFVGITLFQNYCSCKQNVDYNIFESTKSKQDKRREAERENTHPPAQAPPLKDLSYKFWSSLLLDILSMTLLIAVTFCFRSSLFCTAKLYVLALSVIRKLWMVLKSHGGNVAKYSPKGSSQMKAKFPFRAVAAPCLELFRYPVSGITRDQTCCSNGSWVLKVHGKKANNMQFTNVVQRKSIFTNMIHDENDLIKIRMYLKLCIWVHFMFWSIPSTK